MARPVERWLETFMCKQYAETFEAYGYKSLQLVCQLDAHQLRSMGVLPEHCEKIMENVSVLRQSYMGNMGMYEEGGGGRGNPYMGNDGRNMNYPNNPQMGNMPHQQQQPSQQHPQQQQYPDRGSTYYNQDPAQGQMYPPQQPTSRYSNNHGNPYPQSQSMAGPGMYGSHQNYGPPQGYGQGPGPGQGQDRPQYPNNHWNPSNGDTRNMYPMDGHQANMTGNQQMQQSQMRNSQGQQNPQEVADNILQMASSYPNMNGPSAAMSHGQMGPNQNQGMPQNQMSPHQSGPMSGNHMVHGSMNAGGMPANQMGQINQNSMGMGSHPAQMGSNHMGQHQSMMQNSPNQYSGMRHPGPQGSQFVYPNAAQSQPSPMSPMQTQSPHSMPSASPGPMHSPSPSFANMRSPNMQMRSPMHNHMPPTPSPHPQSHGSSGHPSPAMSSSLRSPAHPGSGHFSPNQLPMNSPSGHSSPSSMSSCSQSHSGQQPVLHNLDTGTVSTAGYPQNEASGQPQNRPSANPLGALAKLVMLPESQVVDPKSVVNDACLTQTSEVPKNGEISDHVSNKEVATNDQKCNDEQKCGSDNGDASVSPEKATKKGCDRENTTSNHIDQTQKESKVENDSSVKVSETNMCDSKGKPYVRNLPQAQKKELQEKDAELELKEVSIKSKTAKKSSNKSPKNSKKESDTVTNSLATEISADHDKSKNDVCQSVSYHEKKKETGAEDKNVDDKFGETKKKTLEKSAPKLSPKSPHIESKNSTKKENLNLKHENSPKEKKKEVSSEFKSNSMEKTVRNSNSPRHDMKLNSKLCIEDQLKMFNNGPVKEIHVEICENNICTPEKLRISPRKNKGVHKNSPKQVFNRDKTQNDETSSENRNVSRKRKCSTNEDGDTDTQNGMQGMQKTEKELPKSKKKKLSEEVNDSNTKKSPDSLKGSNKNSVKLNDQYEPSTINDNVKELQKVQKEKKVNEKNECPNKHELGKNSKQINGPVTLLKKTEKTNVKKNAVQEVPKKLKKTMGPKSYKKKMKELMEEKETSSESEQSENEDEVGIDGKTKENKAQEVEKSQNNSGQRTNFKRSVEEVKVDTKKVKYGIELDKKFQTPKVKLERDPMLEMGNITSDMMVNCSSIESKVKLNKKKVTESVKNVSDQESVLERGSDTTQGDNAKASTELRTSARLGARNSKRRNSKYDSSEECLTPSPRRSPSRAASPKGKNSKPLSLNARGNPTRTRKSNVQPNFVTLPSTSEDSEDGEFEPQLKKIQEPGKKEIKKEAKSSADCDKKQEKKSDIKKDKKVSDNVMIKKENITDDSHVLECKPSSQELRACLQNKPEKMLVATSLTSHEPSASSVVDAMPQLKQTLTAQPTPQYSNAATLSVPSKVSQENTPSPQTKKKKGRPLGSKSKVKKGRTKEKIDFDIDYDPEDANLPERLKKMVNMGKRKVKSKDKESVSQQGPYIHITGARASPITCRVVNTPEADNEKLNKKKKLQNVSELRGEKKGLTPTTYTFIDSVPWQCSLCGREANSKSVLGDLYGPYYPEGVSPRDLNSPQASTSGSSEARQKRWSFDSVTTPSSKDMKKKSHKKVKSPGLGSPKHNSEDLPPEIWVHEDCVVWSHGVYLIGNKIHGLDEAVSIARQTVCSVCKTIGATMGCLHKGCTQKYHYLCAIEKECFLDEENFSLTCLKHKNKRLKLMGQQS